MELLLGIEQEQEQEQAEEAEEVVVVVELEMEWSSELYVSSQLRHRLIAKFGS